jgi:hypothetical protein
MSPDSSITGKTVSNQTLHFPILEPRAVLGLIVTPELATWFLEFSSDKFQNRAINDDRVKRYGHDMLSGRWMHNGENIIFDERGVLVDGYTRSTAAFMNQVSFVTDARFGVKEEALPTINTGRPRTLSNALAIGNQGGKAPTALGQGINWLYRYINNFVKDRSKQISHLAAIDFLAAYPGLYDAVTATASVRNKKLATPGVLTAAYYICHEASPTKAEEFFQQLSDGVGYGMLSPVRHLRERLLTKTDRRSEASEQLSLILHAFNKHVAGEQVRQLRPPEDVPVVKGFQRKMAKKTA